MIKIDKNKLVLMETAGEMLDKKYGKTGTPIRDEFEARARAWYYAEVLKDARKKAGITQQQLADRIGKKREYISLIEKGKTDMQLSTFLLMTEAVGLKVVLQH